MTHSVSRHHVPAVLLDTDKVADAGLPYALVMPIDVWLALPEHPRRRDVERHAKKAHWQFARRAQGVMAEALRGVVAAEVAGQLYKVDGHTRSYLWSNAQLVRPDFVFVTVYRCSSFAELHDLYNAFHSQFAAEERYESVLAAYRAHGLELTSKRLRDGMIVDALHIALTGIARSNSKTENGSDEIDIYKAVGFFREELVLLDSLGPRPEVFHGGVVAGCLLALAMRPSELGFFNQLAKSGRRLNRTEIGPSGQRDPVAALLFHLDEIKQSKSTWVKRSQEDLCSRTLRAFFAFILGPESKDYWFDESPPQEDIYPIIKTVRRLKGIVDLR